MANRIISQTTPVKKTKPPAANRQQMSDIVDRTGYLTPSSKFSSLRLHRPSTRKAVQFHRYARENKLIVFRDNHSYTPKYHVNRIETGEPDIVATLAPINDLLEEDDEARLPWHHILSVIEEKGKLDKNKGPRQSGAYLAFATQCRPDLVGMYGMSISPVGYVLQYSCASGLQTSGEFPWADIGPLVSYVYTLYVPHPGFASRDPSVTLADNGDTLGSPSWNIRDGDKVYENCVVKVVGDPWHRMTWVARVGNTPITIKDSYRDAHGSFKEGELYDILHKQGPAPGFLRVKKEYEVEWKKSCPIRVTVDTSTRIKTRLIMHTWGESLPHRWAVLERNIIHRDISHGNILVQAQDFKEEGDKDFEGKEHRPIFANEIVEENMKNADPMARLGDFDNAAELDRMLAVSPTFVARRDTMLMNDEPLRCRTGTPKFIARSPAVGRMLVADNTFRKMPELPSHLVDRYTQVYANDTSGLRTFSDVGTTRHGGVYTEEMAEKHYRDRTLRVKEFEHRPRHDAESVFWCIVVFLLLAAPLGSPPEKPHELEDPDEFGLNCAWKYIANHQIGVRKDIGDSRLSLLRDAEWDEWLHPELADVEPFLLALAAQITPEWGLIEPAPPILHLHEAMQRILLQYIDLWKTQKKDVKFDTGRIRPAEIPDNRVMPQVAHEPSVDGQHIASASLRPKRQANQLGAKEESQPKRRRTTRQGTSSYTEGTSTYNEATTSYKKDVPRSLPPSPRLFAGRRITRQTTRLLNKGTGSYKDVGPQSRPPSPRLLIGSGITRQTSRASNESAGSQKDIGPQSLPPSPRLFMGRRLPLEYSLDEDIFERSLPSTPTSPSTNLLHLSPPVDSQTLDTDGDAEA
ncbi:hypothetical protein PC9H_009119 [Pleurotus ostreatus]|uniref:Uncharacterized protein n=1 Tax=Pleurotus ostreatus TaxID=5322 RepID=A0A8H7DQY4_PLEOS|nr:uncharacterized protein PC9H_009119 [Pleurotus ostreatus]KAF7426750.1 hypothetical protein PC9H_009119 [Pleurotus ostreatus]